MDEGKTPAYMVGGMAMQPGPRYTLHAGRLPIGLWTAVAHGVYTILSLRVLGYRGQGDICQTSW